MFSNAEKPRDLI